jgi:uncharacterized protein YdaU (DUF1376 family)
MPLRDAGGLASPASLSFQGEAPAHAPHWKGTPMTTAKPNTWMPIYWGDYLKDTMHLKAQGHGVYLLLIAAYWTSGEPLPDDDEHLSAITRTDMREWKRLRPIMARFFDIEDGLWKHGRIDDELAKAMAVTSSLSARGRRGAKARWEAEAMVEPMAKACNGHATANAQAMRGDAPSPSPVSKNSTVSTVGDPDGSPAPVPAVINDRMPDIPLALQAHRARDPESMRLLIWNAGLAYLSEGTGKPPAKLRPWLGKLCKAHSDIAVMAALAQAQRDTPADPIAWIERNLNGSRSHDDDLREALADLREGAAG